MTTWMAVSDVQAKVDTGCLLQQHIFCLLLLRRNLPLGTDATGRCSRMMKHYRKRSLARKVMLLRLTFSRSKSHSDLGIKVRKLKYIKTILYIVRKVI